MDVLKPFKFLQSSISRRETRLEEQEERVWVKANCLDGNAHNNSSRCWMLLEGIERLFSISSRIITRKIQSWRLQQPSKSLRKYSSFQELNSRIRIMDVSLNLRRKTEWSTTNSWWKFSNRDCNQLNSIR